MADAIRKVQESTAETWHSGWWGNMQVHAFGGSHRGLCYDWQEIIYRAIAPVAASEGWGSVGIAMNEGRSGEHHAVVVFDPRRVAKGDLLERQGESFVLDAWRRGRPDVYVLAQWLESGRRSHVPPRVEDLELNQEP